MSTTRLHDIALTLPDVPGALAGMAEELGRAGINIHGGGAWVVGGRGIAHFLVDDGAAARRALESAGVTVDAVCEPLVLRLQQERPGQLGALCRRMAEAGVNIQAQYSDHDHRLILVVDDPVAGSAVSAAWQRAAP
ncbi:hypothetical protein [Dyella sp.]|jgi:hypothetical protein|uniref:hypothetical protein n=1 Tax=Dyella sp. TaxID=1869338 RepID=UPI002D76BCB4|nr:hypothetical protein [Dyella sp.]HET6432511.1 hypothetical protein [Dyella sp.]